MKFLSILPLFLVACDSPYNGTETGNPEELTFEYNATSSDQARVRLGESTGGISVDTVWLRLGDVEFVDCNDEVRGTLTGIGFADHGGEEAALQNLTLPDVSYCGLRTQLFDTEGSPDEPAEISGSALSLSGTLADGRPFRVTIDEPIPIQLALPQARLPGENAWLIAFDMAAWLDGDSLDNVPGDEVIVDAENHQWLLESFINRVSNGTSLFVDEDANGQVDEGEEEIAL